MSVDEQLLIRIKNALDGEDLTNNPSLAALYSEYVSWNNAVAARLDECAVLLQKKLKVEAVACARQEPSLLTQLDELLTAERRIMLQLGSLYDWEKPANINFDVVETLRNAASSADDLLPLLAEFRRIARTDMVREKLSLLREISRRDKDNPEWRNSLLEVENKYLSQLISRAQQCIVDKDYEQLDKIYNELQHSPWVVSVPAIVMDKVAKIITDYRMKQRKQQAAELLEKINNAYGAFDNDELQSAFEEFDDFCKESGYTPDDGESVQIREARGYLDDELDKKARITQAKQLIETITSQFDNNAPLEDIEKNYAALNATGENIPDHITNRLIQYRSDTERAVKIKAFIRGCKIVGVFAIILLFLGAAGYAATQWYLEKKQYELLIAEINKGDIESAKSVLAGIDSQYPRLAKREKISAARAKLDALISEENVRAADVQKLLDEVELLAKAAIPDPSVRVKLKTLEALVKTDGEKTRHRELAAEFERSWDRHQRDLNTRITDLGETLRETREQIIAYIRGGKLELAKTELTKFYRLKQQLESLPLLEKPMLDDYNDLLNSGSRLENMLARAETSAREIAAARQKLFNAGDFNSLYDAVGQLAGKVSSDTPATERESIEQLQKDLATIQMILQYQKGILNDKVAAKQPCMYFRDIARQQEINRRLRELHKNLVAEITQAKAAIDSERHGVFRIHSPEYGRMDIYFKSDSLKRISSEKLRMERIIDNKVVEIQKYNDDNPVYLVKIDGQEYFNCTLKYPAEFSWRAFKDSQAWYVDTINEVQKNLHHATSADIVDKLLATVETVCKNDRCAPFWKMYLTQRVLHYLQTIDFIKSPQITEWYQILTQSSKTEIADCFFNISQVRKIEKIISGFDFKSLNDHRKYSRQNLQFMRKFTERKIACVGFVTGDRVKLFREYQQRSGELWCLDEKGTGCYLVGKFTDGEIFWVNRNLAKNRVLFTVSGESTMALQQFMDDNNITLRPQFWPGNVKGDNK